MNATSPHLTLQELAAHERTGPSAAAGRHLAECAACRARSRAVAADGVRFLVTRCQPPPSLIEDVLADIDARAPAGMTRGVTRRRRRRLALRSVAGVAAALAAGAVALALVGLPGARHGGIGGPVVDTAYVVKRVDDALSAAGPGEIAQVTFPGGALLAGGATVAEEWSYGGQWRWVTYSPAGHPVYEEGATTGSVYTQVSYLTRTWSRGPAPGSPAALLPVTHDCGSTGPASVARGLRAAIVCVKLTQAGRQRVDGVEAIELSDSVSAASTDAGPSNANLPAVASLALSSSRKRKSSELARLGVIPPIAKLITSDAMSPHGALVQFWGRAAEALAGLIWLQLYQVASAIGAAVRGGQYRRSQQRSGPMIWLVQLVFDCRDPDAVIRFWGRALEYRNDLCYASTRR